MYNGSDFSEEAFMLLFLTDFLLRVPYYFWGSKNKPNIYYGRLKNRTTEHLGTGSVE